MSERSAELLVEDIPGSIQKILQYTSGMNFDGFVAYEWTVDAVVRCGSRHFFLIRKPFHST